MDKGWKNSGSRTFYYHLITKFREYTAPFSFPKQLGDNKRIIRIFVRLDNAVSETEVTVKSILDFFSNIGGLLALLYEFGAILIDLLTADMYLANFMSLLLMVKSIKPRSTRQKEVKQDSTIPEHKMRLRRTLNSEESTVHKQKRQAMKTRDVEH